MNNLKQVLLNGHHLSPELAGAEIKTAREQLHKHAEAGKGQQAAIICKKCFGLEPEYIRDLLP